MSAEAYLKLVTLQTCRLHICRQVVSMRCWRCPACFLMQRSCSTSCFAKKQRTYFCTVTAASCRCCRQALMWTYCLCATSDAMCCLDWLKWLHPSCCTKVVMFLELADLAAQIAESGGSIDSATAVAAKSSAARGCLA